MSSRRTLLAALGTLGLFTWAAWAQGVDGYEPDDLATQATNIPTNGTYQSHTLWKAPGGGGDLDWVRFNAVAGNTYVVETFPEVGRTEFSCDTFLELYSDLGITLIGSNDDKNGTSWFSRIQFIPAVTGQYYVKVRGWQAFVTGFYRISVTRMNDKVPPWLVATITAPAPQPPVVCNPTGSASVEQATLAGTAVTFTAQAVDDLDPNPTLAFLGSSPPGRASGDTLPLGITSFDYRVTDVSGNTQVCTFSVNIVDTTPPTITARWSTAANPVGGLITPGAVVIVPEDPPGSHSCAVNFTGSATDICDASVAGTPVTFTPPSGTVFAAGDTPAVASIRDASGNEGRIAFVVRVESPPLGAPVLVDEPVFTEGTTNTIYWTGPDPFAGWIELQRADDALFTQNVVTTPHSVTVPTAYLFTGLSDAHTYYYRARYGPMPGAPTDNLIRNGSFETGIFAPWVTDPFAPPVVLIPWHIGIDGFWPENPLGATDGAVSAVNGFDGQGPMTEWMYQEVVFPSDWQGGTLTWSDRVQWWILFGGQLPRTYTVTLRDATNTVLETLYSWTTGPASFIWQDTDWRAHSAAVGSQYAGQLVRVYIEETIPEASSGPASIAFDNFVLKGTQGFTTPTGWSNVVFSEQDVLPPVISAPDMLLEQNSLGGAVPSGLWKQSSQADFTPDTLTNTVATGTGEVVLTQAGAVYANSGTVLSTVIDPQFRNLRPGGDTWGQVFFTTSLPGGTSVTVDVCDGTGAPLVGYTNVASGADLSGLDVTTYPRLRLRGQLQSDSPNHLYTPELRDWSVTFTNGMPFGVIATDTVDPDFPMGFWPDGVHLKLTGQYRPAGSGGAWTAIVNENTVLALGAWEVLWTAQDHFGPDFGNQEPANHITTLLQHINVVDTQPPDLGPITCSYTHPVTGPMQIVVFPGQTAVIEQAALGGTAVSFGAITQDECDVAPRLTFSPPSGTMFPLGDTVVIATATDISGNSRSVPFMIRVVDTIPPDVKGTLPEVQIYQPNGPDPVTGLLMFTWADIVRSQNWWQANEAPPQPHVLRAPDAASMAGVVVDICDANPICIFGIDQGVPVPYAAPITWVMGRNVIQWQVFDQSGNWAIVDQVVTILPLFPDPGGQPVP